MSNNYHIAFDTLTTYDVKSWDYDTRKIVRKAITPIIQEDIKERMENPMAALHGIVEKLYDNRDVLDNEDYIRKLRFAYNGLASALDAQLGRKASYPSIREDEKI